MEIGLGELLLNMSKQVFNSLNPCFSGNRFGRFTDFNDSGDEIERVLILVLVEIGLGASLLSVSKS